MTGSRDGLGKKVIVDVDPSLGIPSVTRNGSVPIDVPDHFDTKRFMEMFLDSLLSF